MACVLQIIVNFHNPWYVPQLLQTNRSACGICPCALILMAATRCRACMAVCTCDQVLAVYP